jgi:hypothetical protein
MKKYVILVLCLLVLFPLVSAEIIQGTIGQSSGWVTSNYNNTGCSASSSAMDLRINDIENSAGTTSFIHFDSPGRTAGFCGGAPNAAQTSVGLSIGSHILANGTIGYQRNYNTAWPTPAEIEGYQYMTFTNWNPGTLTGDQIVTVSYNATALYNMNYGCYNTANCYDIAPTGTGAFTNPGTNQIKTGYYTWNRNYIFINGYSVEQGADMLVTGIVTKNVGGTIYNSRGMVFRSDTGALVASEPTSTASDFTFMTVPRNIIIAARDARGTIWNSSVLPFSDGIPTPTPTATPTPTGSLTGGGTPVPTPTTTGGPSISEFSNVTIQYNDNSAQTPIPGVYTEYYYPQSSDGSWNSRLEGYAGVNGQNTFYMVPRSNTKVVSYKAGYATSTDYFTPSALIYSRVINMLPDVTGQPATFNLTIVVRDSNGGTPISGAYVSWKDDIAGGSGALLTSGSGIATFNSIPATAYIDGILQKSGYNQRTWSIGYLPTGDISLTLYMSASVTAIPTPTPPTYATVSLTATPNSVAVGETVTLTTTCTGSGTCAGPNANIVTYYSKPASSVSATLIGIYKYNATSSGWDFRTSNSAPWQVGSYNQLQITSIPMLSDTYTYTVFVTKNNSVSIGTASAIVVVGGGATQGGLVMKLFAGDKATTGQLGNYYLNITNDITGEFTDIGFVSYNYDKLLPRGSLFTMNCNKSGYVDGSVQFTVPTDIGIVQGSAGALMGCMMFPIGSGASAGNTSVAVHVADVETFFPIGKVLITITATGQTISPRYTGDDGGSALFIIPNNVDYLVTATKEGYCTVSDSGNTGTNTYQYVPLYMKSGSCSIVTPTPTPSITPTVSTTPIGGWGQPANRTAYVCNRAPVNPTYVDVILNTLACNGFEDVQSQNVGISLLIIILASLVLGKVAGGIGVLAGAIVGMLLSIMMGFLPFWLVIVLIIIAGLIFATKLFGLGGG